MIIHYLSVLLCNLQIERVSRKKLARFLVHVHLIADIQQLISLMSLKLTYRSQFKWFCRKMKSVTMSMMKCKQYNMQTHKNIKVILFH